ncbi:MAG: hypothetical protein WC635_17415 [Bacteriovorax sp.]|jgi:hypothetical protein
MDRLKTSTLITVFLLTITAFTSFSAKASLLIEPHIGYNVTGNADYSPDKTKYNGPQYGGRLGVQFVGLMTGLDYTHSTFTHKTTAGNIGEADQKRDQIGVFAGYNFPILLRFWGGYYFSDKITQTSGATYWAKGSGTEFGLGFTGLPFLSINAQYRTSTYDKDVNGTLNPKWKTKEVVLGISIPLTI